MEEKVEISSHSSEEPLRKTLLKTEDARRLLVRHSGWAAAAANDVVRR